MRILVVDDSQEMVRLLGEELRERGYEVAEAHGGDEALSLAKDFVPDVAITDLRMGGADGLDVLAGLRALDPDVPVLIMTAFGSVDSAVQAMQRGAWTYLTKPFRMDEVALQVNNAVAHRTLRLENRRLRSLVASEGLDGMVGHSASMRAVYALVGRLASADAPVLIRGESGTGKERVARALHLGGPRRDRSFVVVNCASVPASLLESELFGHVRGSFTGATSHRKGLFSAADHGTLFLDEIGDMPLDLQSHLLRVIEDRVVRPVGSDAGRFVDVRILAATHQDLDARVKEGRFRHDLYFRLDVLPIRLAPLRERTEDIPELFATFVARFAPTPVTRLAPAALSAFERYGWPGNVRELENVVRRLTLLVDHPTVDVADLQLHASQVLASSASLPPPIVSARAELPTLHQVESDYIAWVIERCGGNKTRAADILGLDVSTIHRRRRRDATEPQGGG